MKCAGTLRTLQNAHFKLQLFPANSAIQTRPKKFFLAQILHTFSKRFLSHFSIFSVVIHNINRLSTVFRLVHSHSEQLRKTGKAPCKTSASPCKAQQKRPARRCPHLQNRSFISIFANYSIFHQKPHNPHVSPSFLGFPHSFFRHYNCRLIRLFTVVLDSDCCWNNYSSSNSRCVIPIWPNPTKRIKSLTSFFFIVK